MKMRNIILFSFCYCFVGNISAMNTTDIYFNLYDFFVHEKILDNISKDLVDSVLVVEDICSGKSDLTKKFGVYDVRVKGAYDGPGYLLIKQGEALWVYINWRMESVTHDLIEINKQNPDLLCDNDLLKYIKCLYARADLPVRVGEKIGSFILLKN